MHIACYRAAAMANQINVFFNVINTIVLGISSFKYDAFIKYDKKYKLNVE